MGPRDPVDPNDCWWCGRDKHSEGCPFYDLKGTLKRHGFLKPEPQPNRTTRVLGSAEWVSTENGFVPAFAAGEQEPYIPPVVERR